MTTEILAAAEELKEERKCVWVIDCAENIPDMYDTSCSSAFFADEVEIGGRYNYCPNCGGKIEVK